MDIIGKNKHRRNRHMFDNSITKLIEKEFCPVKVTDDDKGKQLFTEDDKKKELVKDDKKKELVKEDDKEKQLVTEDDKGKEVVKEDDKEKEIFSMTSCVIL